VSFGRGKREVVCDLLRALGYKVSFASAPDRVLQLSDRELAAVDLLLTDVILPGITGKALAERLRRRRPELRVLFASGYADDVLTQHGLLDRQSFLEKPFTRERLALKVRQALEG
jgi:CheY-like chemotaxis protein